MACWVFGLISGVKKLYPGIKNSPICEKWPFLCKGLLCQRHFKTCCRMMDKNVRANFETKFHWRLLRSATG